MSETYTALKEGFAIADVAAVVLKSGSTNYLMKTASEVNCEAQVDDGEEQLLRKGNKILALYKTDDLIKGYDIRLTDLLTHREVFALLDGGVLTESTGDSFTYTGPVSGSEVTRTACTVEVYAADYDTSGDVSGYLKYTFTNCKGTPVSITLQEGQFYCPEYTIESRPAKGSPTVTITPAKTLPDVS